MRKITILALVVILASALSVVGYTAEESASSAVSFGTKDVVSLTIKENASSTSNVDFGSNLNPLQDYYAVNATTLRVESTADWTITHEIIGEPSDVLSLDYGYINGENKFNSETSYSGDKTVGVGDGGKDVEVSYRLHDLEDLEQQGDYTLAVQFTVST